jgi:hypothetical protein
MAVVVGSRLCRYPLEYERGWMKIQAPALDMQNHEYIGYKISMQGDCFTSVYG